MDILETLNEAHLKVLSIFYKDGIVKNTYPLRTLHEKMGCYVKRKIRSGESVPLSKFCGENNQNNDLITALEPLKGAYLEGLLGDLNSKKIITIKIGIADSQIYEKFVGTELGSVFYKFIMKYK